MVTDILGDTLTRIKNGILAKRDDVKVSNAKVVKELLRVLKQENMILDYVEEGSDILVILLYRENGEPEIENLERESKPGRRVYVGFADIKPVMNGRGILVISTSQGLMTGAQAKSKKLGGELICKVY